MKLNDRIAAVVSATAEVGSVGQTDFQDIHKGMNRVKDDQPVTVPISNGENIDIA